MKAIPSILKENRNVHFVFAGSSQVAPLKRLLDEYGVGPEFYTFVGRVSYEEMPALYARADVCVNPSLMENLSFVILEAMSCGIPVVATAIAGTPEMITHGENGLLVPPRDERRLAEAILTLLGDKGLRLTLGENARHTVLEEFSLDKMAQKTRAVYEDVVGGAVK
jgi:glycosyltransferase involved in cell wall biosynthesis